MNVNEVNISQQTEPGTSTYITVGIMLEVYYAIVNGVVKPIYN